MRVAEFVLFLTVMMFFFSACDSGNRNVSAAVEEETMPTAAKPEILPIPPIDAMAPARVATATFALG